MDIASARSLHQPEEPRSGARAGRRPRPRIAWPLVTSAILHVVALVALPWDVQPPPLRVTVLAEADVPEPLDLAGVSSPIATDAARQDDLGVEDLAVADAAGVAAEGLVDTSLRDWWDAEMAAREAEERARRAEERAVEAAVAVQAQAARPTPRAPVEANLARAEAEGRKVLAKVARSHAEELRQVVNRRLADRATLPPPPRLARSELDPHDKEAKQALRRQVPPPELPTREVRATAAAATRSQVAITPTPGRQIAEVAPEARERGRSVVRKAKAAEPMPAPAPAPSRATPEKGKDTGTGGGDDGGKGRATSVEWLQYVRTDGVAVDTPDPDARAIGGRNVVVARETYAPTNLERSFGTGRVRGDAIPGTEAALLSSGFSDQVFTTDATGLFLVGDHDAYAREASGADSAAAETPVPPRLRLSLLVDDPGDGSAPVPEHHAPRADLPRPTKNAPERVVDGAAPAPTAGSEAPPPVIAEEDSFWSPIQGDPDEPAAGAALRDGTAWSSLEVADRELRRDAVAAVNVRRTELGTWGDAFDQQLRKGSQMPVDLRARGYSGVVEIDMRVRRDGAIERVRVLRSSGVLELDELAIAAVPTRVEPPPTREPWIPYRYRFRFGS